VRSRVAEGVCQGLLGDTINSHLNRGGEGWQALRSVERNIDAVESLLADLCRCLTQCGDQSEFVQGGRTQLIDQAADVGGGLLGPFGEISQERVRERVVSQAIARRLQLEGEPGELWTSPSCRSRRTRRRTSSRARTSRSRER
jgi:hypothetical protein